jgi:hypothetical protein
MWKYSPYTHFQENGRYQPLGERQAELFELLAGIKGKFLMSLDSCREVRALIAKHKMRARQVRTAFGEIEQGKRNPCLLTLKAIADGLKISMSQLFSGLK